MDQLLDHISRVSIHGWLNFVLAFFGALVALGAANRMNKETEMTILCAFVTVGVGMVAQAIGTMLPDSWNDAFDTLLLGGLISLLVGTRRRTIWMRPEIMPKISAAVCALTWVVFFISI